MVNNLSAILGARLIKIGEVAEGTGLHRNTISSIYHKKVNNTELSTLIKLCDYLQVPLHDLIDYEPKEDKGCR